MPSPKKVLPSGQSGREDPAGLVPVLSYEKLLAGLPRDVIAMALMAALHFHKPERYQDWGGGLMCQCRDKGGGRRLWPCPEVRAVIAALGREGQS